METLTIKIKDEKVLDILHNLESLNLIQVVDSAINKPAKKLSTILKGSISKEKAEAMQIELKQMRNEWDRDIS